MNTHLKSSPAKSPPRGTAARRGFSLIEVLLAVFILGIGLIMVASVFPVGANWTRQSAENSIGQNIAEVAVSVIQNHYGPTGDMSQDIGANVWSTNPQNFNTILQGRNPFHLQALPFFTNIPVYERSYQFGANVPFPAPNPKAATYFWTALVRLDPSYRNPNGKVGDSTGDKNNIFLPSPSYKYDIYILVFHKGASDQTFSFGNGELLQMRSNVSTSPFDIYTPSVYCTAPGNAQCQGATLPTGGPALPVGALGIGQSTGVVFRMVVDQAGNPAPRPAIGTDIDNSGTLENVIWSCPANGTSANPLVYVYQTSMTF